MHYLTVSYINADMSDIASAVSDDVSRLKIRHINFYTSCYLVARNSRQTVAECRIYTLYKSRAVSSVCKTCSTVSVRIAYKLNRIIGYILSCASRRLCISLLRFLCRRLCYFFCSCLCRCFCLLFCFLLLFVIRGRVFCFRIFCVSCLLFFFFLFSPLGLFLCLLLFLGTCCKYLFIRYCR